MHQYKTVAQILLILSIFNLVLAAPVVREIHDAHGEVVVPDVVKDVAVVSKERRQSTDGPSSSHSSPPPDESTPSHSPPHPDGSMPLDPSPQFSEGPPPSYSPPPPPDGSMPSHSSLQFPDESTLPHSPPPLSDVSTPSQSSLPPQDGPTPLGSSPPLQDGSMPSPHLPPDTGTAALPFVPAAFQPHLAEVVPPDPMMEEVERNTRRLISGSAIMGIAGILILAYRHHKHHHRTIDPDCSIAKGSRHSCPDD